MPERDFEVISDNLMVELLDLYNMNDWGVSWIEFTEKFTGVMLETIGQWQQEEIG